MSGHKRATVSISQQEYQRLHDAQMRLRYMQKDLPSLVQRISRKVNDSLRESRSDIKAHQQDLCITLQGLDQDLSDIEAASNQALLQQQAQLESDMDEMARQSDTQNQAHLMEIETRFSQNIQALQSEQEGKIHVLTERMQQAATDQQEKQTLALKWIKAASTLLQIIHDQYDHRQFSPGSMDKLENNLILAQQNLAGNLPEAALFQAQQAHAEASNLHLKLEAMQGEYRALSEQACLATYDFHQELLNSSQCPAVDLSGNQLPVMLQVDYWTQGGLSRLIQAVEEAATKLDQHPGTTDSPGLVQYLQETLPTWQATLDELIFQARLAAISAQLRMNIAERVIQVLHGQGYRLIEAGYTHGDQRASYQAQLVNLDGSQILVRVEPGQEEQPQNELHLIANDRIPKTEHELRQRTLEIQRSLEQNGLQVGSLTPDSQAVPQTSPRLPFLSETAQFLQQPEMKPSR